MNRIDLNTPIPSFCADYVHGSVRVRIENVPYGNVGLKSVREVCEMQEEDLFKFRAWGKKSQMELKEALNECGLHLGMSDKELADYEQYWLEEKARDIHSNTINWEQRRWELANRLYFWSEFQGHWKDTIEQAGVFIEEYKKSLNTEE